MVTAFVVVLMGVPALLIAVAALTSHSINYREKHGYLDAYFVTPWELKIPFEEVSFCSADGITLRGWWLRRPGKKLIVGCSGLNGSKSDLIGIGPYLWRSGFNVLLFDFRDRGESDAALRSVGFLERRDLEAALRFARERLPGARTGLIGFSMGAVVALHAASGDPGVRALVADSPFSSLEGLITERYRRRHLPSRLLLAWADRYNRMVFGYRFRDVSPEDAFGRGENPPVLLIHGEKDTVIPVDHARRLYKRAGGVKELWIAEGAGHCGSYFMDRDVYCERVSAFFRKHL